MKDENYVRKEITAALNKVPDWLDINNSEHKRSYAYFKECCKVLRTCISINIFPDVIIETYEVTYYCYLQDIFVIDKELYKLFQIRLDLLIRLLNNILIKNELYESAKNIQYFHTITTNKKLN